MIAEIDLKGGVSQLLKEAEQFFFRAMVGGWAGGGQIVQDLEMPGYKVFVFTRDNFYLVDRWCKAPVEPEDATSWGTTTIWFCPGTSPARPVWMMQYGGSYTPEAAKCVKAALLQAYQDHRFLGGRGPITFPWRSFVYSNFPRQNDFSRFKGQERVFGPGDKLLGWHQYWGMSLVTPQPPA